MVNQTKPQSFKDRDYFPSFRNCPGEYSWDDRYLALLDPLNPDSALGNKKHWCLLAEIIEDDTLIHPRIVAKDHDGTNFVVAFYPDNPDDMPRLMKDFKVGNTIAIFYPLVHVFPDRTLGIRVEESDEVIIIPLKLSEVFEMNKEAIKYTPADGAPLRCHSCDETRDKLLRCVRCESAYYCNKECQATGWNENKHKRFCKALKEKNVKRMQFLDYGHFNGCISFC
ncbi:uncharacterized protein GGS22DRAFT_114170 [Annulohypoxylon maeteangense]|uniref:uncharacterized protein n=1 Tax=Annulohypoxylon maeteangense TaxID=1927788 RepID=UPI002007BC98|nr:uncharacterized protein GGS22DRAFT_114170 [Annulohypoxylon maeteangense]KAI0886490.1 hypothetical protein GGS22DRAFT_114170 [Annulohypoxylon maeteangense]